jgi:hypothetical protein
VGKGGLLKTRGTTSGLSRPEGAGTAFLSSHLGWNGREKVKKRSVIYFSPSWEKTEKMVIKQNALWERVGFFYPYSSRKNVIDHKC